MVEELPLVFGGAIGTGVIDGILEAIYASDPEKWTGKFPYIALPGPLRILPPLDDWIVLGIPAVLYGIGKWRKNKKVEAVGLGGLLYAIPMFIHHIIIRGTWMATGRLGKAQALRMPIVSKEIPLVKEI